MTKSTIFDVVITAEGKKAHGFIQVYKNSLEINIISNKIPFMVSSEMVLKHIPDFVKQVHQGKKNLSFNFDKKMIKIDLKKPTS